MSLLTTLNWRSMTDAPKDGTAFLAYLPRYCAQNLSVRGLHVLHWSGWGGGVWETSGGWRPMDYEVEGGVWMPLDPIIADAEQAAKVFA